VADGRLIDTSDSELERQMLRAAADEKVPADVRRRALASLGLLAIAPVGTIATAPASSEGAAAAGKALGWQAALAKAGAIVGISGAVLGVATTLVRPPVSDAARDADTGSVSRKAAPQQLRVHMTEAAPLSTPPTRSPVPMPANPSSMSAVPRAADRHRAAPARAVAASRSGVSSSGESRTASARRPDALPVAAASIREEIDLLDRARAQLARGNPGAATEIISQYFVRCPNGELRAEAELVRREARLAAQ
jgi:hypothetical protein